MNRANSSGAPRGRIGFTIIELLVAASVIAFVLSLVLPAIQDSRETSRRASCQNNLKQIGVALQNFESQHLQYPNAFCGTVDFPDVQFQRWCVSPSAQLIAYLDDGSRAARIDGVRNAARWDATNLSLDSPLVLRCASDPLAKGQASSYRYCRGVLPLWPGDPGGVFTAFRAHRAAEVADGLSRTAFASERLVGVESYADALRDPALLPAMESVDIAPSCIALNQGSAAALPPPTGMRPVGASWTSGSWIHCTYYHFFPPNTPWRDCLPEAGVVALISARSHHRGGVNVLFGDGRVQLAANEIELQVWRAWATRRGGEAL